MEKSFIVNAYVGDILQTSHEFNREEKAVEFMGELCGCAYNDGEDLFLNARVEYIVIHARQEKQLEFPFMSE